MLKRSVHRSFTSLGLVLASALSLVSCASDLPRGARLALIDPLSILNDVTSDLRLLVLPEEGHGCGADGRLEPALPDAAGTPVDLAVVDITFPIADGSSVDLDPGRYTVLVRGRGTDPISGVGPNELIATGCQAGLEIAAGETREVSIEVKQIINPGMCGDGVLSPDEQCEGDSPSPCMSCRTTAYQVSTTPLNADARAAPPSLAFADGALVVATYDSFTNADGTGSQKVRMMLLDDLGQRISSPTALALDEQVDISAAVSGIQTQSTAASSPVRLAVAFAAHFVGSDPGGDALVRFFDLTRTPMAAPIAATNTSTGAQGQPAIADDRRHGAGRLHQRPEPLGRQRARLRRGIHHSVGRGRRDLGHGPQRRRGAERGGHGLRLRGRLRRRGRHLLPALRSRRRGHGLRRRAGHGRRRGTVRRAGGGSARRALQRGLPRRGLGHAARAHLRRHGRGRGS
ncbi:MAG: hypothetical protein GXP55_18030, partial [Deltaproteobacteria bacterium]|nr:hypothetical protein [Deltaproteobacteria bacterium]